MRAPTLTISLFLLVLQHVSTEGHWESKQLQVEATADSRQRVRGTWVYFQLFPIFFFSFYFAILERVKLLHAGIANLSRPGLDGFRELADAGPVLAHLTPLVRDVTDEEHWSSFLGTKNELNTAIVELNTAIVDLWATLDSAPTPNLNNSDYTAQEINAVIAWIIVYHEKFEVVLFKFYYGQQTDKRPLECRHEAALVFGASTYRTGKPFNSRSQ